MSINAFCKFSLINSNILASPNKQLKRATIDIQKWRKNKANKLVVPGGLLIDTYLTNRSLSCTASKSIHNCFTFDASWATWVMPSCTSTDSRFAKFAQKSTTPLSLSASSISVTLRVRVSNNLQFLNASYTSSTLFVQKMFSFVRVLQLLSSMMLNNSWWLSTIALR